MATMVDATKLTLAQLAELAKRSPNVLTESLRLATAASGRPQETAVSAFASSI